MANKNLTIKILTIAGTLLIWIPLLTPILFSVLRFTRGGNFLLDYLTPAELFPVTLLGGIFLLWAALQTHSQHKLIGWGLGTAVVTLAGSQGLAIATGLASGKIGQNSIWWIVVLLLLVLYLLALLAIGIGGIRLLRGLFRSD